MSPADGTGSERERDSEEDIVLPSWIDAAISRTRERGEPLESHMASPLPEEAVEPMADEPVADEPPTEEWPRQVVPLEQPSTEPFPTFLDRRDSMAYETERIADAPADASQYSEADEYAETGEYTQGEPVAEQSLWPPAGTESAHAQQPQLNQPPEDFLRRRITQEFEAQRAAIVTEAMASDPVANSEPIPLPVVPPRRRAPSGPWLMAALFFAAAALVLAVLIWLRPLPQ